MMVNNIQPVVHVVEIGIGRTVHTGGDFFEFLLRVTTTDGRLELDDPLSCFTVVVGE